MKSRILLLSILSICILSFQSCLKDKCEREITYTKYTPIYKSLGEIQIPINMEMARQLEQPGKIYFYSEYIFINELKEGIHIIDNSVPEAPVNIGFIPIPGNVDIAIRDGILFADNYMDLLAIDISNITAPFLAKRLESTFSKFYLDPENGYLTGYQTEVVTEMFDCETVDRPYGPYGYEQWDDGFLNSDVRPTGSGGPVSTGGVDVSNTGLGGSLARFSLYDDYLYAIDDSDLYIYDISTVADPVNETSYPVGWNIETLYAFGDKLFIGGQNGMTILDASDPSAPQHLSQFWHWTACDPVFVKDNYAYVTLRTGTNCNGSQINQLDLVNISDILNPYSAKTFEMDNPHGLSIKDNNLFLCEGDFGLKVFDIENPLTLDQHLISQFTDIAATDVIVLPGNRNILLVIGSEGFYQYDFDDPTDLKTLSVIPVVRN